MDRLSLFPDDLSSDERLPGSRDLSSKGLRQEGRPSGLPTDVPWALIRCPTAVSPHNFPFILLQPVRQLASSRPYWLLPLLTREKDRLHTSLQTHWRIPRLSHGQYLPSSHWASVRWHLLELSDALTRVPVIGPPAGTEGCRGYAHRSTSLTRSSYSYSWTFLAHELKVYSTNIRFVKLYSNLGSFHHLPGCQLKVGTKIHLLLREWP